MVGTIDLLINLYYINGIKLKGWDIMSTKRFKGVVFSLILLIMTSACSGVDKEIVGKWEDNLIGFVTYEFRSDGTVTIDADEVFEGEYNTSGDTLTIEANGEKMKADYTIDGNTLSLTIEDQETMEFEKVEE